jgi:DNA repair exonuclease SbcCD ATPase subunit
MARRRQFDLIADLPPNEVQRELEHAVGHLYFDLRCARLDEVDRAVRVPVVKAAKAAIARVEAGTLQGKRAYRRVEAIQNKLWDAIERAKVTCPTCGTRVTKSHVRAVRKEKNKRTKRETQRMFQAWISAELGARTGPARARRP